VLAWRRCKCYCFGDLGDTKISGKDSSASRACFAGVPYRNSQHLQSGIDKESIGAELQRYSFFDSSFYRIQNGERQSPQEITDLQNNGDANR
jgi:hypothetical protein